MAGNRQPCSMQPPVCLIALACGLLTFASWNGRAAAQRRNACAVPPCVVNSAPYTLHRTYSGRVYFTFPNYTVYSSGAPRNVDEAIAGVGRGRSVIYRDGAGMSWDGRGYFTHPAYHQELVTRYHYANRTILSQQSPTVFRPATVTTTGLPAPRYAIRTTATSQSYLPTSGSFVRRPPAATLPPLAPPPADVEQPESFSYPGSDRANRSPARVNPQIPAAIRPNYCGSENAVSTAIQPLTDCRP